MTAVTAIPSPGLRTRTVPFGIDVVTVRELTTRQRVKFREVAKESGTIEALLWVCSVTVVEFKGRSVEDIDDFYGPETIGALAVIALELSGLTKGEEDEAGNG